MKFIFSVVMLLSLNAYSWRETGHFTVCEIAYRNLTKVARDKVDRITEGKSFSEQCTWPDMVRKTPRWSHTYPWHFINLEDDLEYFQKKTSIPKVMSLPQFLILLRRYPLMPLTDMKNLLAFDFWATLWATSINPCTWAENLILVETKHS